MERVSVVSVFVVVPSPLYLTIPVVPTTMCISAAVHPGVILCHSLCCPRHHASPGLCRSHSLSSNCHHLFHGDSHQSCLWHVSSTSLYLFCVNLDFSQPKEHSPLSLSYALSAMSTGILLPRNSSMRRTYIYIYMYTCVYICSVS